MISNITPPRVARALLRIAVSSDTRDAVEGDLHELYVERHTTSGVASAAVWYWLQALSFTMRFSFDRLARAIRAITRGETVPALLDLKLGARLLAKSPGLTIVGGLGMAVAVALGAVRTPSSTRTSIPRFRCTRAIVSSRSANSIRCELAKTNSCCTTFSSGSANCAR